MRASWLIRGGDASLAVPVTQAVITSERQVSDAFTKAGPIPVHVDFSQKVVTSFNDAANVGNDAC